jgi:hypothetical protein
VHCTMLHTGGRQPGTLVVYVQMDGVSQLHRTCQRTHCELCTFDNYCVLIQQTG